MGQLPATRVNPGPVFHNTGVDYAGPITIKAGRTRKPVFLKAYLCIFVCLAVKAVHIELVTDLTAESFLAAFRRFVARRGNPNSMFSDHGTNFVAGNRQLKELSQFLRQKECSDQIVHFCATQHIEWSFIPEKAPNFGGLWESTVKAVKRHLSVVTKGYTLTYEETSTILCQIEAILNSRPLVSIDAPDDSGIQVLTPGHFIIGQPLQALPDQEVSRECSLLKRWNMCQKITRDFWKRWSSEYLQLMNRYTKWSKPTQNLEVGDVVLVKDQQLFNCRWPLAIVTKVYPGEDKRVRVASVRTEKGVYRRPTSKLVPLLRIQDDT